MPTRYRKFNKTLVLALLCSICMPPLHAQQESASEILERSIEYHDPEGVWGRFKGTLTIVAQYPERSERVSTITMDQPAGTFKIGLVQDGVEKSYAIGNGDCTLTFQGSENFSEETAEKERLTCERAEMWRNYYSYLYGLPMKLRDKGTNLNPLVERKTFKGKEYLVLKVTYDKEVGEDTWYFYFDPGTYAMEVYQFYHNESKNDGEYILLEGEQEIGAMRLPEKRSWYTNKEDRFLGADLLRD